MPADLVSSAALVPIGSAPVNFKAIQMQKGLSTGRGPLRSIESAHIELWRPYFSSRTHIDCHNRSVVGTQTAAGRPASNEVVWTR